MTQDRIITEVADIYRWIDLQVTEHTSSQTTGTGCDMCGRCCDFADFDHRLYVTTPEMAYFALHAGPNKVRKMDSDVCPYRDKGQCTVHAHRFAGCRIFSCKDALPAETQGRISEQAITGFRALCDRYDMPYGYDQLRNALNQIDP